MAKGCLAALFRIRDSQDSTQQARESRRDQYLQADVMPPVITDSMDEGDLHSGPGGYEANTAYPDTFYGGGADGGYGGDGGGGSGGD